MNNQQLSDMLIYLIPLILLEFGLMIAALISVIKRPVDELRWGNKLPWILIILFINIFGPLAYFIFARVDKEPDAGPGD